MEKGTVTFGFDNLHILTAIGDDVYVRADYSSDDSIDIEECVAIMSRRIFNDAMTEWLDSKKDFNERYNHFCGTGYFLCYEYNEEKEKINILSEDQEEFDRIFMEDEDKAELKYIDARAFRLLVLKLDMEHG